MYISVAMCTFNGEKYIGEQLNSIINQTVPVDEIVICDDVSTDNTISVINAFFLKHDVKTKVNLDINQEQLGVTKNFEKALRNCKGDIIFLSDQDDYWDEHKVERVMELFENDKKNLLVFTDAYLVDSHGCKLGKSLWEVVGLCKKENYEVADFLGKRFVTGATVAIRKELLEHSLPIPSGWIHDAWLAINATLFGKVVACDEKLILYRQHEANVIGARERNIFQKIRYTHNNIAKSIAFRETMQRRFCSFLERNNECLSDKEKTEIKECIIFWEETGKIRNKGIIKGLKIIIKELYNGAYKRYNNGIFGAMVDAEICLFFKEKK